MSEAQEAARVVDKWEPLITEAAGAVEDAIEALDAPIKGFADTCFEMGREVERSRIVDLLADNPACVVTEETQDAILNPSGSEAQAHE